MQRRRFLSLFAPAALAGTGELIPNAPVVPPTPAVLSLPPAVRERADYLRWLQDLRAKLEASPDWYGVRAYSVASVDGLILEARSGGPRR